MASGPITSWEIDGKTTETVTDFIFLGSKISADSHCSQESKRRLLPGRDKVTNVNNIFKKKKKKDNIWPTMVCIVRYIVVPVVMYRCMSWSVKMAEHWSIDGFKLWSWRRLLRVPWAARRPNQSMPKEISPEYSLEGLLLKLNLQYFGHLMEELTHWKRPWCWDKRRNGAGEDEIFVCTQSLSHVQCFA